jgi:NADPH:quinone reductase-like Zn-dependent oxidoreductase
MRAVRFDEYGDYDVLKIVEVPEPEAGPGEVVVKLTAAGVNPFDNTCRRGWVEAVRPGTIQGNEGAGVVVTGTDALPVGTRVMVVGTYGFARSGTWQEQVTASAFEAVKVPDRLSDVEAAAVPVVYLGAQLALTHGVRLEPGMTLLIPGVGGGVGNAAIQLARIHGAGRIITSAGRTEKAEQARSLGYEDVIDLSQESLSEGVKRLTGGTGVDVALDSIGGPITGEALKSVVPGGRVVQMGYTGGTVKVDSSCSSGARLDRAPRRASRASTCTTSPARRSRQPGRSSCPCSRRAGYRRSSTGRSASRRPPRRPATSSRSARSGRWS